RTFLGAPLRSPRGATIGHVVVLDRADGGAFDDLDEATLLDLAAVAGGLLVHGWVDRDARAARSELRRLVTVNLSLLHQVRPERMLKTAADLARSVTEANFAALVLVDPASGEVTTFHHSGLTPAVSGRIGPPPAAAGLLRALMIGTRPVRLTDLRAHPAHGGFPPNHPVMSTLLAAPITVNGVSRGVLVCTNRRHVTGFTAEDEAAASVIAAGIAVALEAADDRGPDLLDRLALSSQRLHEQEQAHWRFLGSMSHELRSSLSGIQMSADLLADPSFAATTGPQTHALAERMATTARHLIALVDNLLDLSRIQSRRLDVTMQALDLDIVLRDVRATLEPAADAAQVLVDIPGGERIPRVLADPVRLRQVLINLLTNAVKFTPAGGHVWVEIGSDDHDTTIAVCDSGVGIPAEDLERIFLPFERGRETQAEGTGLGLSIARAIVELHGGRLEVSSWPGVGSRFTASFRLARAPHLGAEFEAAVEEDIAYAGADTNERRALIVEDDPASEDSTSAVLRAAGYEVLTTQTCAGAVRAVATEPPDVVLLDVQLPDGNGLDIVPRLRELAGERGIVILAFTADRIGDTEERAEQECDGFILKPLRPRELLRRMREALAAR
ncbi:MAG TPA: ATP-binding protein, partial [Candidatus Dormibacteraeota bacterium]|nr:ATP-binding protein [Candidatus Dormibacteraeota bacterium]